MDTFTSSVFGRSGTVHGLLIFLFTFLFPGVTAFSQLNHKFVLGPQLVPMESHAPEDNNSWPAPMTLESNCINSDFSYGDWTNWAACYGFYLTPCQDTGFSLTGTHPVHKIMPGPGYLDHNTCDSLITVFPGESFSARLGDTIYSGAAKKSGELKYQVTVTDQSYLFIYRYAVVLQTGGHTPPNSYQPDFQIMITNSAGEVLDSTCGYYYITAQLSGPPVAGWHRCTWAASGAVYWKDWTTVGMDLTPYFGQTIFITFKVRACSYNTHFGYAYISAYCSYLIVLNSMCEGDTSATLTAPPGFSYLWSTGDTTASITVPNPVTGSSYSCTLTALNGCQVTIVDTLTYTVVHANFTHGIACAGLATQFTDSSTINQNFVTGWNWNFGDGSPPLPGIQNPTHTFTTTGDFTVTLIASSTDGCADTIAKSLHVDSLGIITNTDLRSRICNNNSTDIVLNSTVSNTLYTWTTTVSSPGISGYSDNPSVPGPFINQVLTNSGNKLDSVIYHITPHAGFCTGPETDFVVAVCPVPLLTNSPLLKPICDSTNTNIILTSNVDSTRFTWTCTANPGNNLTGYSDYTILPGILNISQVIHNSGYNIDTVHYHITGNAYGCSGPPYTYNVAVFPMPNLTNSPLSKSICSQDFTNVTLTSNVPGTQFTWTCTPSGPGIGGWSNNTIPVVLLNQQLTNSGTTAGTVTYHITPHANGCNGHVYNYVVTVKPVPTVTNNVNPSQCSGLMTGIILTSNIPGSLFSWTATGSSPFISGYSNSSGPEIAQLLNNTGVNLETVLYRVTASYNGCSGNSTDITVTVFPVADAYFTPPGQVLCSGQSTLLTIASHVSGTTFTWTASGSSGDIGGYSPGVGYTIIQPLTNTGTMVGTVTYIAQPTANGCPGGTGSAMVTVNPVPSVTYTLCHDNVTTVNAQPIRLTGGIPIGGSYSGAGVMAGMFNPSIGIGNHTITYSYTNWVGCSRTATQVIAVSGAPLFFCGNTLTDIRDNKQYPTVKLGPRCWMAANLNFGNTIPSAAMQRDNCINEKYCFNDMAANCTSYGGLYQWDEMMRYVNAPATQGFCPPGWHVPTENEWNALFALYTSSGFAGAPLKFDGYSGFNEYLSGVRHNNVSWDFEAFAIMLWSSSERAPTKAWAHGMNTINPSVSYYPSSKSNAFAVRCIQD